ncbi:MAG: hypothetical protein CMM52_14940 [Rhodospirillaceae bacterium]|nr:hypothetical protein [Rhodospirillaceae bacterium]|tara:strand:+ start:15575 stop:16372 length:798 start_codon:yes stop_codon:yes gene_type:complete
MSEPSVFAVLRHAERIWAIPSIHGDADKFHALQKTISQKFGPGDRLVFLGNILGRGERVKETVDAVLAFRRLILSRRNMLGRDVVMLRGAQEEMWQRLMQLQFAVNPSEILDWMLDQGIGTTLEAYDSGPEDARAAIRQGAMAVTHWTTKIRAAFQAAGHQEWLSSLKHAAYTRDGTLLFVNRGIDPERPLDAQADEFWWGAHAFDTIETSYSGFDRVVRGFDPAARGLTETPYTISCDGGCGRDGTLMAACMDNEGNVLEIVEA